MGPPGNIKQHLSSVKVNIYSIDIDFRGGGRGFSGGRGRGKRFYLLIEIPSYFTGGGDRGGFRGGRGKIQFH
jgi:hypothetical protein